MNDQRWLESLREELSQRGLPEEYRERLWRELSEHLADLREENMNTNDSADSVLGAPSAIARAAAKQQPSWWYTSAMFLAKVALFVLLPLPLLAAGWFLVVMALGGAASAYQWASGGSLKPLGDFFLAEHVIFSKLIMIAMAIGIACVVVSGVGFIARRMRTSWAWPLLATVLVSLATATLFLNIQYTGVSGQNTLTAGLGFGQWDWMVLSQQLLQGILPLAIGVWIARDLRRARAQRRALA